VIDLVSAYIMMKMQVGMDDNVIQEIKKLEQIQLADATYGSYDLVIKVKFRTVEDLERFIFEKIRRIKGVTETSSMIVAREIFTEAK
jgi:DNA-binding Lrp family transcriptional regulator